MTRGESLPPGSAPARPRHDNPVKMRGLLVVTGVLLAVLLALGLVFELGAHSRVVAQLPLPLDRLGQAGSASGVVFTPTLELEGPTTLLVRLSVTGPAGWLGVACALVHQETGEVREFSLGTSYQPTERSAEALVDRIPSGPYVLRLSPSWQPMGEARNAAPPAASIRLIEGERSYANLGVAALVLLCPLLVSTFRWLHHERRMRSVP